VILLEAERNRRGIVIFEVAGSRIRKTGVGARLNQATGTGTGGIERNAYRVRNNALERRIKNLRLVCSNGTCYTVLRCP